MGMKDFLTGIVFLFFGITFYFYSKIYSLGTASNMGPGFFPTLISGALMVLGILLISKILVKK